MLDFNHILSTPGYDIQQFYGTTGTTLLQWQTWKKPRGINWVYMIGVGGAGGGGTGRNTATTSGGGGGGGTGGQSTLLIPAQFVPDTLYIQAGAGGLGGTTTGSTGNNGVPTYVCIEPSTTLTTNMTVLLAQNGGAGGAGGAAGGTAGLAGSAAVIGQMPLAARGVYTLLVGQAGTAGGTVTPVAGTNLSPPTTGLMVTGGAGGGGASAAAGAVGGSILTLGGMLGTDFFALPISGGSAAVGAVPAGAGRPGVVSKNYLMNFGGAGGGGCSGGNAAGIAGAGGDGAPGCGGGGGGAPNSVATTVAKGGDGGPGFVIIISW
jgi:hypothetical protein